NQGRLSGFLSWSVPPDSVEPIARQAALGRLLTEGKTQEVRQRARQSLGHASRRGTLLRRLGETFAWGVRMGRQLASALFSIEMITGGELGYTRLKHNRIYISPLPLLRGHQKGEEVVRGLILHELGHHRYHKGPAPEGVWEQSEREGLQPLLNLVSDEHLERRLRAENQDFGDLLKQLGAYAFQH